MRRLAAGPLSGGLLAPLLVTPLLVTPLLVTACSAAAHVATTSSPVASTPAPTRPGGLVGAIDAARVAAVCANAHAAQTLSVAGGSAGKDALVAAAVLLERPPVDPTAATAATRIRADLRAGQVDAAVTVALAFCRAHGN